MTRTSTNTLAALLRGALLALGLVGFVAAPATASNLAVAEAGADAPGLDPAGPNDEDNAFAPDDYEPNFLWGGVVGLAGMLLGGLALGALAWRLMVKSDS